MAWTIRGVSERRVCVGIGIRGSLFVPISSLDAPSRLMGEGVEDAQD